MIYADVDLTSGWSGEVKSDLAYKPREDVIVKIRSGDAALLLSARRSDLERLRTLIEAALMEISLAEADAEREAAGTAA